MVKPGGQVASYRYAVSPKTRTTYQRHPPAFAIANSEHSGMVMRSVCVCFTETGRPFSQQSPRPCHPVPGVLRAPRALAILISIAIALLFTGCASKKETTPPVRLQFGGATPGISVRVGGQETFSQRELSATLNPYPAQSSQLPIVVRLTFPRPTAPPPGVFVRCGDSYLTPKYQERAWEFYGEIPPVPFCLFGVGGKTVEIPTGIQEFRLVVGDSEVVIAPTTQESKPAPLWIERKNQQARALNAIVILPTINEGQIRIWGVTGNQPQVICNRRASVQVRPLTSPGAYEILFPAPIQEDTCLVFTRDCLLLVVYFRQAPQ